MVEVLNSDNHLHAHLLNESSRPLAEFVKIDEPSIDRIERQIGSPPIEDGAVVFPAVSPLMATPIARQIVGVVKTINDRKVELEAPRDRIVPYYFSTEPGGYGQPFIAFKDEAGTITPERAKLAIDVISYATSLIIGREHKWDSEEGKPTLKGLLTDKSRLYGLSIK